MKSATIFILFLAAFTCNGFEVSRPQIRGKVFFLIHHFFQLFCYIEKKNELTCGACKIFVDVIRNVITDPTNEQSVLETH
jgi:hypothetical protein